MPKYLKNKNSDYLCLVKKKKLMPDSYRNSSTLNESEQ